MNNASILTQLKLQFVEITANNCIKTPENGVPVITGIETLKSLWTLAGIEFINRKVGFVTGNEAHVDSFESRTTFRGSYSDSSEYIREAQLGWITGENSIEKISEKKFSVGFSSYRGDLFGERSESYYSDTTYEGVCYDSIFRIAEERTHFGEYTPVVKVTGVHTPTEQIMALLGQILIEEKKNVPVSEKDILLVEAPELTDRLIKDVSDYFWGKYSEFYWTKSRSSTEISTAKLLTYHDGTQEFEDRKKHSRWFYYSDKINISERIQTTGWDGFTLSTFDGVGKVQFVNPHHVVGLTKLFGVHKTPSYHRDYVMWGNEYEFSVLDVNGELTSAKEVPISKYTPYYIGRNVAVSNQFDCLHIYFQKGIVRKGLNEELRVLYSAFSDKKWILRELTEYAAEVQPNLVGYEILLPTFE